ncbi:hypothetical protein HY024_05145, partial [Candidatus Curtissbacteria bacterium]|nr:hypothetical protein [Candidatus Curtissbacteria bacterium]
MAARSKSTRKDQKLAVSIVGVGRVGLPLAIYLADKGFDVWGIDTDENKIATVSKGQMPFMEEGAQPLLAKYINKSLNLTTNFANVSKTDVIILTLG